MKAKNNKSPVLPGTGRVSVYGLDFTNQTPIIHTSDWLQKKKTELNRTQSDDEKSSMQPTESVHGDKFKGCVQHCLSAWHGVKL